MDSTSTTVWGIDLGTTYSCIARIDETGHPVVVNNREGDQITPSVVMLMDADMVEVGKSAKGQMQLEPDLVCELVKQNMGDPDWRFRAHGKEWSAPEISSFILKALAEDAAMQSGIPVERAVITVPAYFGVAEREATIAAGKMAGLVVEDVINEPTAAAFSYGFAQASDVDETVLVYDLGGGTFDVTVIRLEPTGDGGSRIRVVATGGDDRLGGALWDKRMVKLLADKFQEQLPDAADPLDDDIASADLRINAEDVKRALTARDSVSQVVMAGVDRASVKVTRAEFEAATDDLLEQTIDFTRTTVAKAAERGRADDRPGPARRRIELHARGQPPPDGGLPRLEPRAAGSQPGRRQGRRARRAAGGVALDDRRRPREASRTARRQPRSRSRTSPRRRASRRRRDRRCSRRR